MPPPLLVAFSASAAAFVRTLSYPNSYPRKYGYVQPAGQRKFLHLPHRLAVFTDYGSPGPWPAAFSLFSLRRAAATKNARVAPLPTAATPRPLLFLSGPFHPCATISTTYPTPPGRRSAFLHAPNACGPLVEFFLLVEEIETRSDPRRDFNGLLPLLSV